MHPQRIVIVSASGAGMLGTFLPWASLGGFASADGTRLDGWGSFACMTLTLLIALLGPRVVSMTTRQRFAIAMVAIASGLIALRDLTAAHDIDYVNIGGGLYLATLASLVVLVTASIGDHPFPAMVSIIAAAATTFFGFVHIPYGSKLPTTKLCSKRGWSLAETFPDVDEYIGTAVSGPKQKTLAALVDCGVLRMDAPPQRDHGAGEHQSSSPPSGPRCEVPNAGTFGHTAYGHCVDLDTCIDPAIYYKGYCEGPANVVCCVSP